MKCHYCPSPASAAGTIFWDGYTWEVAPLCSMCWTVRNVNILSDPTWKAALDIANSPILKSQLPEFQKARDKWLQIAAELKHK